MTKDNRIFLKSLFKLNQCCVNNLLRGLESKVLSVQFEIQSYFYLPIPPNPHHTTHADLLMLRVGCGNESLSHIT